MDDRSTAPFRPGAARLAKRNLRTLEHVEIHPDRVDQWLRRTRITKVDLVDRSRVAEVGAEVRALVDRTGMAGAPSVTVSGATGAGLPALREQLVRLVIILKKDANVQVVINQLWRYTPLQSTLHALNIVLVNRVPKTLNLAQLIAQFFR